MNVNTNEVRGYELGNMPPTGFEPLPNYLQHAAKRKLKGKNSASVSLTSGGKLSRYAASRRKANRKQARKARQENRSN